MLIERWKTKIKWIKMTTELLAKTGPIHLFHELVGPPAFRRGSSMRANLLICSNRPRSFRLLWMIFSKKARIFFIIAEAGGLLKVNAQINGKGL